MQGKTVKQHYVPCVLLSRFGEGEGRDAVVWVWDKATGRCWQSKVSEIAFQNDLYTVPDEAMCQVDLPDWFPEEFRGSRGWEAMFRFLEGSFGEVVGEVERTLVLPPKGSWQLDLLLRMLVLFELRTPAHMEQMRQLTELGYNVAARVEANRRADGTNPVEVPSLVVPFDENRHILFAQSMTRWEEIVGLQHRREWSLWLCIEDDLLVTDYPVSRCFARPPERTLDNPAPRTPNTVYFLPLGRGLLMSGDDKLAPSTRLGSKNLVAYHNRVALLSSERFVYTIGDNFNVLLFEGAGHAYRTIASAESTVLTIGRTEFRRLSDAGFLKKPRRWGVHGGGELHELVPPDHRISSEELMEEIESNRG